MTSLCHGVEKAIAAQETAIAVFENGKVGDDLPTITVETIKIANYAKVINNNPLHNQDLNWTLTKLLEA